MKKTKATLVLVLAIVGGMVLSSCSNTQSQNNTGQLKPQTVTQAQDGFKEVSPDRELMQKAEQGDAEAQYEIGKFYAKGVGKPKDANEAIKWFTKSAEQGYATAQGVLGILYYKGDYVPQDNSKAIEWLTKAAQQGNTTARNYLDEIKGIQEQIDRLKAYKVGVLTDDQFRSDGWMRSPDFNMIGVAKIKGKGDEIESCTLGYYNPSTPKSTVGDITTPVCDVNFENRILSSIIWRDGYK